MIFKILTAEQWRQFQTDGVFNGSADDLRDGFIHLSTREQIAGTLQKHFAGQTGLVIAAIDERKLGALKWEPSRGGALFPHLYGPLPFDAVAGHETPDTEVSAP